MTAAADPARVTGSGDLDLLLPPDWWVVYLQDERARRRAVRGLVDHQFGRSDKRSKLARDLGRELDATTRAAALAGGRLMAFSLMQADDRPLSASLTTFRLPAPAVSRVPRKTDALTRFASGLTGTDEGGAEVVVASGPQGTVVRAVGTEHGPADLDAESLEQLTARYWLDPDDGQGWYHLVFTTHHLPLREAMLALFDAIVASVGHSDDADDDSDPSSHV